MLQAILTWLGNYILKLANPHYDDDRKAVEEEAKRVAAENQILLADVAILRQREIDGALRISALQAMLEASLVRQHTLEQERVVIDAKEKERLDKLPPSDHVHVDTGDV